MAQRNSSKTIHRYIECNKFEAEKMKHQKMNKIALERIYRLFELAAKQTQTNPFRSKRYISIALEISKKTRTKIPDELKTKYCKKCKIALQEKINCEITKQGTITIVKCNACEFSRKIGRKK